jgi:hypothetical protein
VQSRGTVTPGEGREAVHQGGCQAGGSTPEYAGIGGCGGTGWFRDVCDSRQSDVRADRSSIANPLERFATTVRAE